MFRKLAFVASLMLIIASCNQKNQDQIKEQARKDLETAKAALAQLETATLNGKLDTTQFRTFSNNITTILTNLERASMERFLI